MSAGIYRIINKANNRFYIGSSSNIELRIKKHIRLLKKGTHENEYMQNDFKKTHGSFDYEIVCLIDCEQTRLEKETELILASHDNQNFCYNINKTAYVVGRVKTMEGLLRIQKTASENAKKLWDNPEFRHKHQQLTQSSEWKNKVIAKTIEANSKTYDIVLISPDGYEYIIGRNLSEFCRQHILPKSALYGLVSGRYKNVKGWVVKKDNVARVRVKNADHEIFEVGVNKSEFCRKHNIPSVSHFSALIKGKLKSCYGWVVVN
jgi:group I intron endonuclease